MTAVEYRPTRFSRAVVVLVTVLTVAVVVAAVGSIQLALYGAGGALALALLLWSLDSDRWRPVGAALAAPAFPVVGLALITGTGYAIAAQLRGTIPVGSVFLIAGATMAVFGAVLAVRDVLDRRALTRCLGTGARATAVVGSAMVLAVTLSVTPLGRRISGAVQAGIAWLLDPVSTVPLASFLALVAGFLYLGRAAVLALPIYELFGPHIDDRTRRRSAAVGRYLRLAAPLFGVALLVSMAIELGSSNPYPWLPAGVRGVIGAVTSATTLRIVLIAFSTVSLGIVVGTKLLQRAYRTEQRAVLIEIVPYASGAALAIATLRFSDPFVAALVGRITPRLPAQLIDPFKRGVAEAVSVYGEAAIALAVVTGLSLLTVALVFALLVSVLAGLVSDRAGGVSLAAAGLFTAAAFAPAVGASVELSVVGIVAGLLVWDVGEFGVTVGEELGTGAATVRSELVHAGGTLLVGTGAIALTLLAERGTGRLALESVPVVPALVGAIAAALLLIIASR